MNQQQERPSVSQQTVFSEDAVVVMPNIDIALPDQTDTADDAFQKRNRFRPFLLIYFLVFLMLIIGTLIGLYGFLVNYEASTPNAALDQYIEWLRNKDYNSIYEAADFKETVLNDKNSHLEFLERIYSGNPTEITLRERSSQIDGQKQFSVYYDDTRVSILDLIPYDDDDGWRVVPQLVYQEDFTVYVSPEMRVTVNGQDIALLGLTATQAQETVFQGLKDASLYPKVSTYTISGLLNPPVIEALTLNGESCLVTADTSNPQIIRVMAACSEESRLEQEEYAKNAAFTYAQFIARDASRNTLLKLIYKETALYDSIRNFSNAFFTRHESYEFKDVELLNAVRYTDTDFTCEVKFNPYYVRDGKTHQGETVHYRMTFLRFESGWQIVALTPVANTSSSTSTTDTTTSSATTTTTAIS